MSNYNNSSRKCKERLVLYSSKHNIPKKTSVQEKGRTSSRRISIKPERASDQNVLSLVVLTQEENVCIALEISNLYSFWNIMKLKRIYQQITSDSIKNKEIAMASDHL
jgi:hypothetical protein